MALRKFLILRGCECIEMTSVMGEYFARRPGGGRDLGLCYSGILDPAFAGVTRSRGRWIVSQTLKRPPTRPRFARPEDRLRCRLEGRTTRILVIVDFLTVSSAGLRHERD